MGEIDFRPILVPAKHVTVINKGIGGNVVTQVLKHYHSAYALKADSPAIDAGDPVVKDGKPDIGAVEFVKE